jgi:hypothetical protein
LRATRNRQGRIRLANTYDAAIETHDFSVSRTNDAAVTARHLLWKQGATAAGAAIADATNPAIGTIDNVESSTGLRQSVLLLGKGPTKKMVAAGEIAIGAVVYQAAGGKVDDTGTLQVGYALTGAAANNDIIEVLDQPATDISGT